MTHLEAQPQTGFFDKFKDFLYLTWEETLDLVFPPRCTHCERVDTRWCSQCESLLENFPLDIHQREIDPLAGVACTQLHLGVLRSAIHALKYHSNQDLGELLGERLSDTLNALKWDIDFIIPVPLHSSRFRKRGYNQSMVLGRALAHQSNLSITDEALIREKDTRSQVGLNRTERLQNMASAFVATPLVQDKTLLIVDDVCTTGATLSACASAALSGGAKRVYALTLAFAHD
jgi:competence protein ComFC